MSTFGYHTCLCTPTHTHKYEHLHTTPPTQEKKGKKRDRYQEAEKWKKTQKSTLVANTSSPLQQRLTEHLLCTHWALSLPREGDRSVAEPVPPISGPGLGKQHTHPHPCTPTDALGKVGAEKGTALGGHRHSGGYHPQRLSPRVKWQRLVLKGCC